MKNKIVYIALSIDLLHHGHINLINHAKKYGKGYFAYLGWGGETALGWAEDKISKMQRAGEI